LARAAEREREQPGGNLQALECEGGSLPGQAGLWELKVETVLAVAELGRSEQRVDVTSATVQTQPNHEEGV